MDTPHFAPASPSQMPASHIRHHHPYFAPSEVDYLSEKQRGRTPSLDKARQQACGFIEAVGTKIGFPRKTIATAQTLYHRFHLFFPRKDFSHYDATLACLYVSTKMHDTLKKPREILMASYAVRFPERAARSKAVGGEVEMDPKTVEDDRQRLLGIERLVLETICFNFTVKTAFPYVIKLGRSLEATKRLTQFAWRLTVDANRTLIPLSYPPHAIALACLYLASLLTAFEQPPNEEDPDYAAAKRIETMLSHRGEWEREYKTWIADLESICHSIIDLLISCAQNPSATTSPSTPSSPHPSYPSPRPGAMHPHASTNINAPPVPFKPDTLMRLKIAMRNREHPPAHSQTGQDGIRDLRESGSTAGLGRNEGTVRFKFGPDGAAGDSL